MLDPARMDVRHTPSHVGHREGAQGGGIKQVYSACRWTTPPSTMPMLPQAHPVQRLPPVVLDPAGVDVRQAPWHVGHKQSAAFEVNLEVMLTFFGWWLAAGSRSN